jgi:hypothetical protein
MSGLRGGAGDHRFWNDNTEQSRRAAILDAVHRETSIGRLD